MARGDNARRGSRPDRYFLTHTRGFSDRRLSMNRSRIIAALFSLATIPIAGSTAVPGQRSGEPRVFLLGIKGEDREKKSADQAVTKIDNEARKALTSRVESIVSKQATPPSGDKHDYMSQAPYFWRNPNTATGFPYVRRDGE